MIKNPLEILIHVCSFLTYWTGLYNSEMQGKILEGVQTLLAYAHKMMASQAPATATARILPPTTKDEQDEQDDGELN
jgi:hypothetical protein